MKKKDIFKSQCHHCIHKFKQIEVQDHGKENGRVRELEMIEMNLQAEFIQGRDLIHQEMILVLCNPMIDLVVME